MGDHVSQQSIGSNVEGYSQAHVGTTLVHLARELVFLRVDIKLTEHMARLE
jgi:hypothetical protein